MARLTESEYRAEVKRLKARVNGLVRQHNTVEQLLASVGVHVLDNRLADAVDELIEIRKAEHAELDQAAINGTQGIDISTLPAAVVERLNVLAKAAAYFRTAVEQQAGLPAGTIVLDAQQRPIGVTLSPAMEGRTINITARGVETPVVKDRCDEPPTCHHTESMNGLHVSIAYSGKHTERQQSIIGLGFRLITTLLRKNQDYGNSAARSPLFAPELSPDAAVRVRMSDKAERIISLSSPENSGPAVKNESLQDTYLDLAGYCILQTINLHAAKQS